jgi:hypothetical protein
LKTLLYNLSHFQVSLVDQQDLEGRLLLGILVDLQDQQPLAIRVLLEDQLLPGNLLGLVLLYPLLVPEDLLRLLHPELHEDQLLPGVPEDLLGLDLLYLLLVPEDL